MILNDSTYPHSIVNHSYGATFIFQIPNDFIGQELKFNCEAGRGNVIYINPPNKTEARSTFCIHSLAY